MGNDARSWATIFAFFALAILMVFLRPEAAVESPAARIREAHFRETVTPHVEPFVVASR